MRSTELPCNVPEVCCHVQELWELTWQQRQAAKPTSNCFILWQEMPSKLLLHISAYVVKMHK